MGRSRCVIFNIVGPARISICKDEDSRLPRICSAHVPRVTRVGAQLPRQGNRVHSPILSSDIFRVRIVTSKSAVGVAVVVHDPYAYCTTNSFPPKRA